MKYIRSLMIIISLFLSCTVNVFATTSFHINMTYQTLVKKMHSQMEIAGSQSEVQWKSSHPKVASISTSGLITAKKAGTTKKATVNSSPIKSSSKNSGYPNAFQIVSTTLIRIFTKMAIRRNTSAWLPVLSPAVSSMLSSSGTHP